ncbi:hypothetical protein WJX74_009912 [Apatococcus lobatus]|uniref:Protein kinase domain-containing protein n=1 Tax=Apatococcus lobatus TaxID=904363 RepID=A0AAW1SBT8_9CHLO
MDENVDIDAAGVTTALERICALESRLRQAIQATHPLSSSFDKDFVAADREREALLVVREQLELLEDKLREYRSLDAQQADDKTMVLSQLDSLRRELVTAAHDNFSRVVFGKDVIKEVISFAEVNSSDQDKENDKADGPPTPTQGPAHHPTAHAPSTASFKSTPSRSPPSTMPPSSVRSERAPLEVRLPLNVSIEHGMPRLAHANSPPAASSPQQHGRRGLQAESPRHYGRSMQPDSPGSRFRGSSLPDSPPQNRLRSSRRADSPQRSSRGALEEADRIIYAARHARHPSREQQKERSSPQLEPGRVRDEELYSTTNGSSVYQFDPEYGGKVNLRRMQPQPPQPHYYHSPASHYQAHQERPRNRSLFPHEQTEDRSDDAASVTSSRSRMIPPKHSPPRQIVRLNHAASIGRPIPSHPSRSPVRPSRRGRLQGALGSLLATCGVIVAAGASTAAIVASFSMLGQAARSHGRSRVQRQEKWRALPGPEASPPGSLFAAPRHPAEPRQPDAHIQTAKHEPELKIEPECPRSPPHLPAPGTLEKRTFYRAPLTEDQAHYLLRKEKERWTGKLTLRGSPYGLRGSTELDPAKTYVLCLTDPAGGPSSSASSPSVQQPADASGLAANRLNDYSDLRSTNLELAEQLLLAQNSAQTCAQLGGKFFQSLSYNTTLNSEALLTELKPDLAGVSPEKMAREVMEFIAEHWGLGWEKMAAAEKVLAEKMHAPRVQDPRLLIIPADGPQERPKRTANSTETASPKTLRTAKNTSPSKSGGPSLTPRQGPAALHMSADGPAAAVNAAEVQGAFCLLLRAVKHLFPDLPWHAWNTSGSGVDGHHGRLDLAFTFQSAVSWQQLLFLGELKASLRSGSEYMTALGQVMDRAVEMTAHQHTRPHCYAFVAGDDSLELLKVAREHGVVMRTGQQQFYWGADSPGLILLMKLLLAPQDVHGHQPDMRVVVETDAGRVEHVILLDIRQAEGSCVSSSNSSSSLTVPLQPNLHPGAQQPRHRPRRVAKLRGTKVWQGVLPGRGHDQLPQPVVLKFGRSTCINHEAAAIKTLRGLGTPNVIECVAVGAGDEPFICTAPLGRTLNRLDPAPVILSAIEAAAQTVKHMAGLEPPWVHRDLSLGNIIIDLDHGKAALPNGNTYIIDWVTAQPIDSGTCQLGDLTGATQRLRALFWASTQPCADGGYNSEVTPQQFLDALQPPDNT